MHDVFSGPSLQVPHTVSTDIPLSEPSPITPTSLWGELGKYVLLNTTQHKPLLQDKFLNLIMATTSPSFFMVESAVHIQFQAHNRYSTYICVILSFISFQNLYEVILIILIAHE